jgi:hypothetical protein
MLTRGYDRNADNPIDLSRYAAINADHAAETVSAKYNFIPTTRALAVLADYGWHPVQAIEARTRKEAIAGFQKHAIRLANPKFNRELQVGSTIPQLLLTNSHAGTAAFELSLALFEKVCSNGLIVARGNAEQIRVTHRGYGDEFMEAALHEVAAGVEPTLQLTDEYKQMRLTDGERQAFAAAAIELRWNGEEFAVDPGRLLWTRRSEEKAPTMWNTYNVAQEAIIRGGVPQRDVRAGSKTYGRQTRSRKVAGLDENIRLNRALWRLTEEMAKLKAQ